MTYQPHQWKVGDKITSARLNNIENGINNSGVVYIDAEPPTNIDDPTVLNASYNDIKNYMDAGKLVFLRYYHSDQLNQSCILTLIEGYQHHQSVYEIYYRDGRFTSSSPDDNLTAELPK